MSNTILVVDDLSLSRVILRARLNAACYQVRLARSGEEALEIARSTLPDLVLMDCEMPGADGPSICRTLRSDPLTAHIPVILFSADATRAKRVHALRSGADDFLSKPLDESYLMSRLRGLLRRSTLEHDFRQHATPALRAGLEQAISENARRARVALVQPDPGQATDPLLSGACLHDHVLALPDALAPVSEADVPDVFLLSPEVMTQHGLALISDFRSRPLTADVPVIVCLPSTLDIACGMALDLGAEAVFRLPLDTEIAQLRLEATILQKKRADALRTTLGSELDLASRDPLTGLFNRRHALSCLAEMFDPTRAGRITRLALLMIDLDNFKQVNDRFGHSAGDQVLMEVSKRMRMALRAGDLLARYGGEEFLLALPDVSAQVAQDMAERLLGQIEGEGYSVPGCVGKLRVTASFGLAMHDCTGHAVHVPVANHIQGLIDQADQALHSAKSAGRNRVALGLTAVA